MSHFFLIGGLWGFLLAFLISYTAGSSMMGAARNAMIAAIITAFFTKWVAGQFVSLWAHYKLKQLKRKLDGEDDPPGDKG